MKSVTRVERYCCAVTRTDAVQNSDVREKSPTPTAGALEKLQFNDFQGAGDRARTGDVQLGKETGLRIYDAE